MPTLQEIKANAAHIVRTAQVPATAFTLFYMLIALVLNLLDALGTELLPEMASNFIYLLVLLSSPVLTAGFVMYCMRIYRRERVEYRDLFDGFSFVGKVLGLYFLMVLFIALWYMLFIIPGFVAMYRYRFAVYYLYEDPTISPREALRRSKSQTMGWKMALFRLDLSFLGWILLASAPSYVLFLLEYFDVFSPNAFLRVLIAWVVSTAVYLIYLARYQVSQYTIFNLARSAQLPPTQQ